MFKCPYADLVKWKHIKRLKQKLALQIFDVSFSTRDKFLQFQKKKKKNATIWLCKIHWIWLHTRTHEESVKYPPEKQNKKHTTFHKVRIKWHGVSASITVEDRTLSNKDTGGTAAFQREE